MAGFPSYCADSLLMITSSSTGCRCSCIGHYVFLHTRPDNRPNQVRLRYVPSTSYRFLQTPPLASDALASRIQFPMNRAWSLTSSDWVCQLRWANKKARNFQKAGLLSWSCGQQQPCVFAQSQPFAKPTTECSATVIGRRATRVPHPSR